MSLPLASHLRILGAHTLIHADRCRRLSLSLPLTLHLILSRIRHVILMGQTRIQMLRVVRCVQTPIQELLVVMRTFGWLVQSSSGALVEAVLD